MPNLSRVALLGFRRHFKSASLWPFREKGRAHGLVKHHKKLLSCDSRLFVVSDYITSMKKRPVLKLYCDCIFRSEYCRDILSFNTILLQPMTCSMLNFEKWTGLFVILLSRQHYSWWWLTEEVFCKHVMLGPVVYGETVPSEWSMRQIKGKILEHYSCLKDLLCSGGCPYDSTSNSNAQVRKQGLNAVQSVHTATEQRPSLAKQSRKEKEAHCHSPYGERKIKCLHRET